ncbi:hypothetical protein [Marinobacter adhaerens]|uniref:hypothetical protein n=1 Tax=Marinobacter adhaerens TaxID=1033846 RepID=UPI001E4B0B20|nr:hypothetical protein [Marinobacter adhaerens]MCD1645718.1 hypothetical protein [Marinobacter adhaerens]
MAWQFIPHPPSMVENNVTQRDQFRNEEVELSDTIVRESIQNSLDATQPGGVTRVHFKTTGAERLDRHFVTQLFAEQLPHARASARDVDEVDFDNPDALIIEDFGTGGLTGQTDAKDDGNFSDFWHRHGKSHKTGTSRGRWGLGKLVYSTSSMLGVFFGLTIREGDPNRYLMGQSVLELHPLDGKQYPAHAYYADMEGEGEVYYQTPVPLRDSDEIEKFASQFAIERTTETGLSIIIPFPHDGLMPERMIGVAINNYFYPILTGQLVLKFNDVELTADNIRELAHKHADTAKLKDIDPLFDFIEASNAAISGGELVSLKESWVDDERLTEEDFEEGVVDELREAFSKGELVGIRLPLSIKTKPDNTKRHTYFHVCVQRPESLEKGLDLYVRGGLTLPAESKFGDRKAFGAMVADEETISAFLGDAENPAHTKWTTNAEKLRRNYVAPDKRLKVVRNAVVNFYDMLVQAEEEEDLQALSKFFSMPGAEAKKKKERKPDRPEPPEPPRDLPPPTLRVARIETTSDGFSIKPAQGAESASYPMEFKVSLAYETAASGNPFKKYSRFDFDLSKKGEISTEVSKSVQVMSANENILELEILGPDFEIALSGFDPNRDIKVKLNASESEEA